MTVNGPKAKAKELLKLDQIEFTSINARGRGDDVRFKLEIQVAGARQRRCPTI